MPHFICSTCKAGLYSAARAEDLMDARCPTCGVSCDPARGPEDVTVSQPTMAGGPRPLPIRSSSFSRGAVASTDGDADTTRTATRLETRA